MRRATFLASVRADFVDILTYERGRFEVVSIVEGHRDIDALFRDED